MWPWLIASFVDAWLRVRGNTEAARDEARSRFVEPLISHLEEAGLVHVSEIPMRIRRARRAVVRFRRGRSASSCAFSA